MIGGVPLATPAEFEQVSEVYDQTLPSHVAEHYVRRRVAFFRQVLAPGARVLDVGCGTGRLGAAMRGAGFTVVGVDVSAGMLSHARRRNVAAVCASVDRLPFADSTFDGA